MSFSRWRTRLRLRPARVLPEESHGVVEVAHRVDYASPSAFIQAFRKECGRTPGQCLRQGVGSAPR
ncbi:helix-turn-helix domain-containing protein [Streptomyces sp. enrichment culture]|uniref:helix-turn-helix domain-containing protein n=1 Tax=Streptomyces sp. enrichment culture TaxID=1795815 RepID=UPI003F5500A1